MNHGLVCWKCGASLADYSLPLRRLEECRACRAQLHVCRMCVEYDTHYAKHCREPTSAISSSRGRLPAMPAASMPRRARAPNSRSCSASDGHGP
jgi:hypothetical protein